MNQFAQPFFMGIVYGRPEQRNGDCFDALIDNPPNGIARGVFVQRSEHLAIESDALIDPFAQRLGDQRGGLGLLGNMGYLNCGLEFQPVSRLHDEDRVGMPAACQQANPRSLVLHQSVRAHGTAMVDLRIGQHVFKRDAMHFGGGAQRSNETGLKIRRSRRRLADPHDRRGTVLRRPDRDTVGERTADIDTHNVSHPAPSKFALVYDMVLQLDV